MADRFFVSIHPKGQCSVRKGKRRSDFYQDGETYEGVWFERCQRWAISYNGKRYWFPDPRFRETDWTYMGRIEDWSTEPAWTEPPSSEPEVVPEPPRLKTLADLFAEDGALGG